MRDETKCGSYFGTKYRDRNSIKRWPNSGPTVVNRELMYREIKKFNIIICCPPLRIVLGASK